MKIILQAAYLEYSIASPMQALASALYRRKSTLLNDKDLKLHAMSNAEVLLLLITTGNDLPVGPNSPKDFWNDQL